MTSGGAPAATVGPYVLRRALSLRVVRWLYSCYYFWPGRVEPIARKLNVDPRRVRRLLSTLRRTSRYVPAFNAPTPFTCEVRYWKLGLKLLLIKVKGFDKNLRALSKNLSSLDPEVRKEVVWLGEWLRTYMGLKDSIHGLAYIHAPLGREKELLRRAEEAFTNLGAYGIECLGVVEGFLDNHIDYERYVRYILEGEDARKVWDELLQQLLGGRNPSLERKLPEDVWDESYVVRPPDDVALIYEAFVGDLDYSKPGIGVRTFRAIESLNFNSLRGLKELASDIGVDVNSAPKYVKHAVEKYVLCFYPGFSVNLHDKYFIVLLKFRYMHDVENFVKGVWGFPVIRCLCRVRINGNGRHVSFFAFVRSEEEGLFMNFLSKACREGVVDDIVLMELIDYSKFVKCTLPAGFYLGSGEYRID